MIKDNNKAKNDLARLLMSNAYNVERLQPSLNDAAYLHLLDLRDALMSYSTNDSIRVLDFGCGGSPYKIMFPNSEYMRADFMHCEGLDFLLSEDSTLPCPDEEFNLILSTQVLEHVPEPSHYIKECFRVLKPGGHLLLTTHGLFQEHGCPHDFYRWTAEGLCRLVEQCGGFEIIDIKKLTCGPRAICTLLNQSIGSARTVKFSLFAAGLKLARATWRIFPAWLNRCAEKHWKCYAIKNGLASDDTLYIALMIYAKRI